MRPLYKTLSIAACIATLAGCSSTPDGMYGPDIEGDKSAAQVNPYKASQSVLTDRTPKESMGVVTTPLGENAYNVEVIDLSNPNVSEEQLEAVAPYIPVIYFGLDEYSLSPESLETLRYYADVMRSNTSRRMSIQGHTDERGTSNYNLALGERRALAVREAFIGFGINMNRLDAISYGEEKPAVMGANEEAWAKNRRVELIFE